MNNIMPEEIKSNRNARKVMTLENKIKELIIKIYRTPKYDKYAEKLTNLIEELNNLK